MSLHIFDIIECIHQDSLANTTKNLWNCGWTILKILHKLNKNKTHSCSKCHVTDKDFWSRSGYLFRVMMHKAIVGFFMIPALKFSDRQTVNSHLKTALSLSTLYNALTIQETKIKEIFPWVQFLSLVRYMHELCQEANIFFEIYISFPLEKQICIYFEITSFFSSHFPAHTISNRWIGIFY